jgi:hypothetical protein
VVFIVKPSIERCSKCKLSLLCATRTWLDEMYWCVNCQGWWLKKHNLFVDCIHFLGTKKIEKFWGIIMRHNLAMPNRIYRILNDDHAFTHKTTLMCPLCNSSKDPVEVIEGTCFGN